MVRGARGVLSAISNAKQLVKLQSLLTSHKQQQVTKGHFTVYVGEVERKKYTVPIAYLSHPSFQELLKYAEEEFGFNHPIGGLIIPCDEQVFIRVTSRLRSL